ncbi:hypothetical protein T12_6925 [Trichinella patagoniensis]|uniref:Uncharacterized protein n=1 Tax=Trichinella patagoniensis TaxID=990121 RepID=A0A0V0Z6W2_9BILA|nr:hypothetical protein T12_6925 [Trichinella patagoniensis]
MAGCFSSAPDAERSGFVQEGAQRAQVTPGGHVSTRPQLVDLFSEALSLGDPHPGLLGCIQLLNSQGSAPALSGGGSAVPHKAEAKCGDPEQPLDVAISSGVENVILGVRHYRNQQSPFWGRVPVFGASLPPDRRAILAPATNGSCLSVPSKTIRGSHAGSTSRWISLTRLRTNGFHRLAADRTHGSVTSLSLQQNRERTSSCNALWAKRISLAAVRAPISSNLGRLKRFTGETRVFAATKLIRVAPDAVSIRK